MLDANPQPPMCLSLIGVRRRELCTIIRMVVTTSPRRRIGLVFMLILQLLFRTLVSCQIGPRSTGILRQIVLEFLQFHPGLHVGSTPDHAAKLNRTRIRLVLEAIGPRSHNTRPSGGHRTQARCPALGGAGTCRIDRRICP